MKIPHPSTSRSAFACTAFLFRLVGLCCVALLGCLPLRLLAASYTSAAITSDTSVASHVATGKTYSHAINLNASSTVTVNGVAFGFGTGNGGGSQPARNYTLTAFNNSVTNFNSTATGNIHTLLATRGTKSWFFQY